MKKSDLRTGMRVTLKNGRSFIVLLNFKHVYDKTTDILLSSEGNTSWNCLSYYNDDLTHHDYDGDDIVKVEVPEHAYALFNKSYRYQCVWERTEPKEMTVEEIQNILGYKIKVVESR
jgi:hypothetical protein